MVFDHHAAVAAHRRCEGHEVADHAVVRHIAIDVQVKKAADARVRSDGGERAQDGTFGHRTVVERHVVCGPHLERFRTAGGQQRGDVLSVGGISHRHVEMLAARIGEEAFCADDAVAVDLRLGRHVDHEDGLAVVAVTALRDAVNRRRHHLTPEPTRTEDGKQVHGRCWFGWHGGRDHKWLGWGR